MCAIASSAGLLFVVSSLGGFGVHDCFPKEFWCAL